jgi:hypothetical protein
MRADVCPEPPKKDSVRGGRKALALARLVRVAVALEEFAAQCAENVESYSMRGKPYGGPSKMPGVPNFAPDIEWGAMDPALVARALSFENLVRIADHSLRSSDGNFTRGVAEAECRDHCACLGAEAWELAEAMRTAAGLPLKIDQLPWNYPRLLQREATLTRERQAQFRRDQFGPEVL